jgi:hypothetical protein
MNILSIFVAFALTSSPAPAPNYSSWISPEIADCIKTATINGEYYEYLDFNGDGNLNIADAVGVSKRYEDNVKYGNEITIGADTVESIITENYNIDAIYWEFDLINDDVVREYEITTDSIITARIYIEFIDYSTDFVTIEINPFEETATVIS